MTDRARLTIAASAGLTAGLLAVGGGPAAHADTCTGPTVDVFVAKGTPLSGVTRPTVEATCDTATYNATVRVYLDVGAHRVAAPGSLRLQMVGQTPSHSIVRISQRQLDAARLYGRQSGHRYADLKFVIHLDADVSGRTPPSYALDSFPRL